MAQNVYDQTGFFEGYGRLRRSVLGLDGAPEWPAMKAMLPNVRRLRVVDLGCGYGWFCRWAAEHGAADILGLDLSEKMLAKARADTAAATIRYGIADLEELSLGENSADLIYSSLALHYVEDAERLFRTIYGALVPGGDFVFSTEHPIFMASRRPGWIETGDGTEVWPVDHYSVEGPRITDWLGARVVKHHRTIGTTLSLLIREGFEIGDIQEFCPTDAEIVASPELANEIHRPMFLLVSAKRAEE